MTLCLSNADLKAVQTAATTLVSALDFESVDAWADRAMADVIAALGADKAYFVLPTSNAGTYTAFTGERTEEGLGAYLSYFWRVDQVLMRRRVERGLEVYHRDMLYHPGEMMRDELHIDWCIPHGLHDTLGMGFDVEPSPSLPALLHVYHHRTSTALFGDRGVKLMQLLLPSFKAGVAAWRTFYESRRALTSCLDSLRAAIAIYDVDGRLVHRTPALSSLLEADNDRSLIEREMACLGRGLALSSQHLHRTNGSGQPAPASRHVVTRGARYKLFPCIAPSALTGRATVIVSVERSGRAEVDVAAVARRFALTKRETMVGQLLTRGESAAAIAQMLNTSSHTVRHHIEHIMGKLDAHSRTEVVARLMNSEIES